MPLNSVAELRARARARLPRMVFDYIDGGAGDEAAMARNLAAFQARAFVPRVFRSVGPRNLATKFLGQDYGLPFGVTPMGLGNLAWPGTDVALAEAAAAARVPYSLSAVGSTTVERIAQAAGTFAWFQIYLGIDSDLVDDLVRRAAACGIETLIVTVDSNFPGRRLRNTRNRFSLPMRMTPGVLTDLALHPFWSLATYQYGAPSFANYRGYSGPDGKPYSFARMMVSLAGARIAWDELDRLRGQWRGKLLVKGVLHPDDARQIAAAGADGIVVSNHGGRQLASVIAALDALPGIRAAVGPKFPLLLDSGVRTGEDVAKALAVGADFVLVGRPFLYGAAALGPAPGGKAVIAILTAELESAMAQIGVGSVDEINGDLLGAPR